MNSMGVVFYEKKKYNTALVYFSAALPLLEKHYPANNRQTAHTLNNIGLVYIEKKDYDLALEYLVKAYHMREVLHAHHPDTAASLNNTGMVHHHQHRYSAVIDYYTRAMNLYVKTLPTRHPDVVQTEDNIKLAESQWRNEEGVMVQILDVVDVMVVNGNLDFLDF
ncbi:unnamed protein product [Didymodactylos carnosus]|uniref:Kinesin light chain n=1 Tax=Didymodactylos carnosus TaxID=1234261 RepID=A0A814WXZ9_9BILA|nr:unnamed protein product [Didymodactylos carnosus]CAF1356021.1 unnamed protein product [Didymodactylos carnosus]CAF3972168.1 unnamed protein product [Didymodactylos carnosus]CAF4166316.1 unnamed protein product [Didymodactylos carnosus]